ncbi:MAG: nitrate reductase molybdenum cofactor assembly chaperone [Desulfobacterales bacterium]|jgi:nitrate reductase delta subunit|nr:nitrate reductase molybdenum cofactor assembly chaperone [Desulfobacteraceae bacterium]MDD3992537.1 nitrate reductase molybdenum cofactor assembly chaperone [Desulfobacteraceae bacterium]MDY0312107.1 nitrate reductase molybdenum cofactor assembly chaperone [Desulfobacterales bacterium]
MKTRKENPLTADALALVSRLLQYPDEAFFADLPAMATAANRMPPGPLADAVEGFLEEIKSHGPVVWQEKYTAAFDMNPALTLNLTHHALGDTEPRAAALANLARTYAAAGWAPITGELPDYLPLMLEFLSICPAPDGSAAVWQTLEGLAAYVARLASEAPAYAALLAPLARVCAGPGASGNGNPRPASQNA